MYRGASHESVLRCFPQSCRVYLSMVRPWLSRCLRGLHAREVSNPVVMCRMMPSGIETPSGDNLFNPHGCGS